MSAVAPAPKLRSLGASRTGATVAAVLLAAAVLAVGPRPILVGLAWLAIVTPTLVAVDAAEHRLPDAIVLPGFPVALGGVALDAGASGTSALPAVLAAAGYATVLLLLHLVGGMGFGDVKLAPVLGLIAGGTTSAAGVLAPVAAFAIGGVLAAVALVRGRRELAFGPPMLIGAWAAILLTA